MLKRFLVFILLFLAAGYTLAQDMPPLPSDAPPSAVPAKDDTMPSLPDAGSSTAPAVAAPVPATGSDVPALPDTGGAPAAPVGNDMPTLPDANASSATPAVSSSALAAGSDMPALPDAGGNSATPANSSNPASSSDMPALPDTSAPAMAPASSDMPALPSESGTNAAPVAAAPAPVAAKVMAKPVHVRQPWKESKVRPDTILGGWVRAKGGNITSRLSWASQQVLNVMDAKKYKGKEEGVYEGEQNKGPQYRKFNFVVPDSKDTVFVLLKQVGRKMWLRVGPDEEPAFANHSYARVEKIRQEDLTVLHILKAKFGARLMPHHMVPSWTAKFDRQRETADE
jgi:hypothetical protein